MAVGVGSQKILGRIHAATVKIGSEYIMCSFSVLEDQSMDVLFGLDQLKRHGAVIDLSQNKLCIMGQSISFLGEHDLPKAGESETAKAKAAADGSSSSCSVGASASGAKAMGDDEEDGSTSSASASSAPASAAAAPSAAAGSGSGAAANLSGSQQNALANLLGALMTNGSLSAQANAAAATNAAATNAAAPVTPVDAPALVPGTPIPTRAPGNAASVSPAAASDVNAANAAAVPATPATPATVRPSGAAAAGGVGAPQRAPASAAVSASPVPAPAALSGLPEYLVTRTCHNISINGSIWSH